MLENTASTKVAALIGVSVLVLGGAVAGFGTYAFFTETDSAGNQVVSSGTMDLTIDGTNNGVTNSFTLTNAQPGDSTSHTYTLRNVGSTSADHAEVTISSTEYSGEAAEPSDTDLDTELGNVQTQQQIKVTKYEYQNDAGTLLTDMLGGVTDANGNGIKDLAEIVNQTGTTDSLNAPQVNSGNKTQLVLNLQVASDDGSFTGSDEDIMADGIDVKIDVTLNQDSSQ